MNERNQHEAMDSMLGASFELVPIESKRVDHSRMAWSDIAEFLRAPKAARYPAPEEFAQTRFGPL